MVPHSVTPFRMEVTAPTVGRGKVDWWNARGGKCGMTLIPGIDPVHWSAWNLLNVSPRWKAEIYMLVSPVVRQACTGLGDNRSGYGAVLSEPVLATWQTDSCYHQVIIQVYKHINHLDWKNHYQDCVRLLTESTDWYSNSSRTANYWVDLVDLISALPESPSPRPNPASQKFHPPPQNCQPPFSLINTYQKCAQKICPPPSPVISSPPPQLTLCRLLGLCVNPLK